MTILVFLMAMTGLFLCSFAWYRKGVQVGQRKKEDFMSDRQDVYKRQPLLVQRQG